MTSATHNLLGPETHLQGIERCIDQRSERIKFIVESLFALVILVALTPVILLALLLVRMTSRGPTIYTQKRLGRHGRSFTIYKIRTMYQNSEPNGPRWCVPGDSRVTPVGRLLRWTHVDELPQLINILQGEMSLIGPRPERPEIIEGLERALPGYRRRLLVRPGVTGLAQVLQPPDTELGMVRSKLFFDLHYLDHWSFWLDLRILLATMLHVLNVPAERIAQVFRFPQGPSSLKEGGASSTEASPMTTTVQPQFSEA